MRLSRPSSRNNAAKEQVPQKLVCHRLTPTGFETFEPGTGGIFPSGMFPGLWLDNTVLQQGMATPEHATSRRKLRWENVEGS